MASPGQQSGPNWPELEEGLARSIFRHNEDNV